MEAEKGMVEKALGKKSTNSRSDWYEETGEGPAGGGGHQSEEWYEETGEGPPENEEEGNGDNQYDSINQLIAGVRRKETSKRQQQREKEQNAKEKAREERKKEYKKELRKRQKRRPNPFPFDKGQAMKRRDGDPVWRGVLWLDSIHAVSVSGVCGVKKLLACLIKAFIEEAIW